MIALPHRRPVEPPPVPVAPAPRVSLYGAPTFAVDAVDALDCRAAAMHVVGTRCTCEDHYMEVKRAYWVVETKLILHEVDEAAGWRCGDTYTPEVSR